MPITDIDFETLDYSDDVRLFSTEEEDVFVIPNHADNDLDREIYRDDVSRNWFVRGIHNEAADVVVESSGRRPSRRLQAFGSAEEAAYAVLVEPRALQQVGDVAGESYEMALAADGSEVMAVQWRPGGPDDQQWVAFMRDERFPDRSYGATCDEAIAAFFGMNDDE